MKKYFDFCTLYLRNENILQILLKFLLNSDEYSSFKANYSFFFKKYFYALNSKEKAVDAMKKKKS